MKKHLILYGPPGTGKTSLAKFVANYAIGQDWCNGVSLTTATAEWTTFDTLGGLIPSSDRTASSSLIFQCGVILDCFRPWPEVRWLIIDEINRADIAKAFGQFLTVLSGDESESPVELPYTITDDEGVQHRISIKPVALQSDEFVEHIFEVPEDWRIIGTMNVYDKGFLFKLSYAFMRRFAFIEVDILPKEEYERLIERLLGTSNNESSLTDSVRELPGDTRSFLRSKLSALLFGQTTAAKMSRFQESRKIGPAIIKDIICYVAEDLAISGTSFNQEAAFCEALGLFVLPQLEGLRGNEILEIYKQTLQNFDARSKLAGQIEDMFGVRIDRG